MLPTFMTDARRAMRGAIRPMLSAAAVAAALTLGACSDDGVSPVQPSLDRTRHSSRSGDHSARAAITGSRVTAGVLRRTTSAVEADSAVIDWKGGVLELRGSGLRIVVPKGAVKRPTRFSVRTVPGSLAAYEFQPHGVAFAQPLQFEQDLSKTEWGRLDARTLSLEGAYFADPSQVNPTEATAIVNEFLPIDLDVKNRMVRMSLWHFSGYMMSTGRRGVE
jgi:hypothetical protein